MQKAITVTKNVTVALPTKGTKLAAFIPVGMRGKTLRNIFNKNEARFAVAHEVLAFAARG